MARVFGIVAGACALCVLLRLPALHMPLDRDLAAYATIGQNLNEGLVPHLDLFDHKQPLAYLVYSLLDLIAPRSTEAIRLAAGVVAGLLCTIVFFGLRAPMGVRAAAVAAVLTGLLGATDWSEGTGLNTEHVLVLVETAAVVLVLSRGGDDGWRVPFAAGVLGALSMMSKGTGAFVVPVLALGLLLARPGAARATLAALAGGLALPIALWFGGYALLGGLDELWYSNITYNDRYLGRPFGELRDNVGMNWLLVLVSLAALAVAGLRVLAGRADRVTWVLGAWVGATLAAALLSSRGFGHYFAPVVPAVAALLAHGLPGGRVPQPRPAVAVTAAALTVATIASLADVIDRARIGSGQAMTYEYFGAESHPWVEATQLAPAVRARARPGDRMYAQGSDPNIYWATDVRPAARFFYNLPVTLDPVRWARSVERDVCRSLPRFWVKSTHAYPVEYPACLDRAPYVPLARKGTTTVYELRRSTT